MGPIIIVLRLLGVGALLGPFIAMAVEKPNDLATIFHYLAVIFTLIAISPFKNRFVVLSAFLALFSTIAGGLILGMNKKKDKDWGTWEGEGPATKNKWIHYGLFLGAQIGILLSSSSADNKMIQSGSILTTIILIILGILFQTRKI